MVAALKSSPERGGGPPQAVVGPRAVDSTPPSALSRCHHLQVGHAPGMTLSCRGQFNLLIVPGRI